MVTGSFLFLKARRQRKEVEKGARKQKKMVREEATTRSTAVACPL